MKDVSILFLGKEQDEHTNKALAFCRQNSRTVSAYLSKWGDPLPEDISRWEGDFIISYLSRWIVPDHLLKKARIAAINFHPGPPEYPGIGCNNFALYDGTDKYGATCHYMAPSVDTGEIIAVKRFSVFPSDTVSSLLARTYEYQLVLFYEVMSLVFAGKKLEPSKEKWQRKPFTRDEFNALCKITPEITKEELSKKIRATNYGAWKPSIELHGFTFELKSEN